MNYFNGDVISAAKTVADYLKNAGRILILTHENPDGDAVGSAFGLCHALRALGKDASVFLGEPCERFAFLGDNSVPSGEYDLVVSVDAAEKNLLKYAGKYADIIDITIDHHPGRGDFARKAKLIEPSAAAAAELVFVVIKALGAKLSFEVCEAIFCGIVSDTNCFRYKNTCAESYGISAELAESGYNGGELIKRLFETRTKSSIELETLLFHGAEFFCDGAVVVGKITGEMIEKAQATEDDIGSLSGFLRSIEGVECSAILKKNGSGEIKVSTRSENFVDVSEICRKYGGGGHVRAAGCVFALPMDEAYEIMKGELIAAYDKVRNN